MRSPVTFTFDLEEDGQPPAPTPRYALATRRVLEHLAARGVRATFFVVGELADGSPRSSATWRRRGTRSGSTGCVTSPSRSSARPASPTSCGEARRCSRRSRRRRCGATARRSSRSPPRRRGRRRRCSRPASRTRPACCRPATRCTAGRGAPGAVPLGRTAWSSCRARCWGGAGWRSPTSAASTSATCPAPRCGSPRRAPTRAPAGATLHPYDFDPGAPFACCPRRAGLVSRILHDRRRDTFQRVDDVLDAAGAGPPLREVAEALDRTALPVFGM